MQAVFINLDRAGERRAFMEAQGRRLGLALERIQAVDAAAIAPSTAARLSQTWERPLSAAELACFLSHRSAWEQVSRAGKPVLVLEDDAVLSLRLAGALVHLAAIGDADLVNLEDFGKRRFVSKVARPLAGGIALRRAFRDKAGAAAYLLWPHGAERLLRHAEGRAAPADAFIHALADFRAFQCEPALAIQAHVLSERGFPSPLAGPSSVQAPRRKLRAKPANARYILRRLAADVRLAGHHLRRLGPASYRRVSIDPADFSDHSAS